MVSLNIHTHERGSAEWRVFGYPKSERRRRHDQGFEPDERLTLRHLCAHVTVDQYQALTASYTGILQQAVEADVP